MNRGLCPALSVLVYFVFNGSGVIRSSPGHLGFFPPLLQAPVDPRRAWLSLMNSVCRPQAAVLAHNPGKVVPWFQSCVYQLQVCRDVLITQCGAGILTNVRKAAEMSHCLEPKGKTRPYRVHRNHCHKHLIEKPFKRLH